MCSTSPESQDFGLLTLYKNLLIDGLAKTPSIVIVFDESLNEVLQ